MDRKSMLIAFLKNLRDEIINAFEAFEKDKTFKRTSWEYQKGSGGGEMSVLRGDVFEKAAVNFSAVSGDRFPFSQEKVPFFATGVSLITHMKSPHMPTVHMNVRYMEKGDENWFGGGYDLTPMGVSYDEDTKHFHQVAKDCLGSLYPEFQKRAKEYFYIPHRKKERGVGGIFFDHYNTGDFEKDLMMWKSVGKSFLDAIIPIYKKHVGKPYTEKEKEKQLALRAHYVEFNLMYDQGTKFGFLSGGNPEAILCSMPPVVKW